MVFRVPDQPELEMSSMRSNFRLNESVCLVRDALGPSLHIWKCPAEPTPSIAFWIGDKGIDEGCQAYLALHPTSLGTREVLEGKRAWTAPMYRRRGFGAELLRAAAADAALMTDRGGVTDAAYSLWSSATGFVRAWWDTKLLVLVHEKDVPAADRFTHWEVEGKRYQLVLSLKEP